MSIRGQRTKRSDVPRNRLRDVGVCGIVAMTVLAASSDAVAAKSPASGQDKFELKAAQTGLDVGNVINPPTAGEMTEMALAILERRSTEVGMPFLLVMEVESTDNLPNNDNAIGGLRGLKRADDVIGVARRFQEQSPNTLIITAADSDAAAMQVVSPPPLDDTGNTTSIIGNPTGRDVDRIDFPVDGIEGRGTAPFVAEPDAFEQELPFAIAWIGTPDVAGAILSRAQGLNAFQLGESFFERFDNTDVYRMMYLSLFGIALPSGEGQLAPER